MPLRVLGVGIRATAANVWTAIQTFGSGLLKLRNPANTFDYIFKGGAIVADRDVTMPLLTGADVLVTEGMAQTLSNKTIGVASMGTGATTLTGVVIGAGTAALAGTALTALQSIRMNAGGTAYEGFTPADGTVTSVTGSAPVASSGGATPAISITGAAGQVLAGSGPAFTATPTLGASGTLGSLAMGNATSGTITVQPVTGALGTVTVSLPAATDTLVGRATTDTLTNKTIGVASMGTGATTLTGVVIGAGTAALTGLALTALQSIRMNAGGTAYEGFTPGSGTVTDVTGTAPVASSGGATPAISITGAAGQVLAGAGPAFTATPTLGASGTLGSLAMGNATSGTVTLQPVTGALGTVTVSIPAATDTLVGKATTDTLTNKTLTSPAITTPTGIVKGDVGLGNVDNTSDATKDAAAATLTNKTLTAPDINGGTADALTSLAVRSTGTGAFDLKIANAENLTVGAKTLTVQVGDADRTLILGASPSLSGTNTGDNAGVTSVTGTAPIASSGGTTPAISLDDGGVALAKMANLAQDQFIGRTTASTGVPETATITAAARTVLDDTTVAAMVDTLGGAAATGTGGLARASSPTFVTPALGTPASGVMTNVTGIPVGALANGTDGNLITWDANGVAAVVATGTAAQVLTSNGAGAAPTFQAAAGGGAPIEDIVSSAFETAGRFVDTVTSGGTVTYGNTGQSQNTSGTATSGTYSVMHLESTGGAAGNAGLGSPQCSEHMRVATLGTDLNWLWSLGYNVTNGSALTFTYRHFGFKIIRAGSGTASLYATQGDNTTETASAALATVTAADEFDLVFKVNGTTSADYYYREDGGAQSAATNLTGNFPSLAGTMSDLGNNISNVDVASASTVISYRTSYRR